VIQRHRRLAQWVSGVVTGLVILAVGGTFVDFHFLAAQAPAELALPRPQPGSPVATSAIAGSWKVGSGSIAGYRIQEVVLFQKKTIVGRTNNVSGSMVIAGGTATQASFTVHVANVATSKSERNVMGVTNYPTAQFVLTRPIALGIISAGESAEYRGVGSFTVHGVARIVTARLSAEYLGNSIYVLGDIPIPYSDWNISIAGAGVLGGLESPWTLEVLLRLNRGS
jgi:polyisoprenoid-binding protein YceI